MSSFAESELFGRGPRPRITFIVGVEKKISAKKNSVSSCRIQVRGYKMLGAATVDEMRASKIIKQSVF